MVFGLEIPIRFGNIARKNKGYGEIILDAKRNTFAEIFKKIKQSTILQHLNMGKIFGVLAFTAILIYTGKSWYDGLNGHDQYIDPPFAGHSENAAEDSAELSVPQNITVTSENGLELKLTYKEELAELVYGYDYEFTNTTDNDIDRFCDEFTGAEYMDKFYALWVIDSEALEVKAIVYWDDGMPQSTHSYTVKPNETVTGYVILNFRNISED